MSDSKGEPFGGEGKLFHDRRRGTPRESRKLAKGRRNQGGGKGNPALLGTSELLSQRCGGTVQGRRQIEVNGRLRTREGVAHSHQILPWTLTKVPCRLPGEKKKNAG